jgi:hypothetical protein
MLSVRVGYTLITTGTKKGGRSLACISHQSHGTMQPGMFGHEAFKYDRVHDCFICPANEKLFLYDHKGPRDAGNGYLSRRYRAKREVCEKCHFFSECVSSCRNGRQVVRNINAEYVEWADNCLRPYERKYFKSRRWHKAEGSFADAANNHGFKRARWRGIVKVQIQNLIIAATQNLRKLLKAKNSKPCFSSAASVLKTLQQAFLLCFYNLTAENRITVCFFYNYASEY